MALQSQIVALSLAGLDTKSSEKWVVPGKLLNLENAVYDETGALRKRPGYVDLGRNINTIGSYGTTSLSAAVACASYQNEILLADGINLYSYSHANQGYLSKGGLKSVIPTITHSHRDTTDDANPDSAVHPSGLRGIFYENSRGGCYFTVQDHVSGQTVLFDVPISNASQPRVLALGSYLVFIYVNTSNHKLEGFTIDAATLASSVIFSILTDLNATHPKYDACVSGSRIFIAYNNSSNHVSVEYLTTGMSLNGPVANTGTTMSNGCISIFPDADGNNLVVLYATSTPAIRAWGVHWTDLSDWFADFAVVSSPGAQPLNITGIAESLGLFTAWWTITASPAYNNRVETATFTPASSTLNSVFKRSVSLAGKPFIQDGNFYMAVQYSSTTQNTVFIVDSGGNILAKLLAGTAGGASTSSMIPGAWAVEPGVWNYSFLQTDLLTTDVTLFNPSAIVGANAVYTNHGTVCVELDFTNPSQAWAKAVIGNTLFLGGGILTAYDGQGKPVEHGFHLAPEAPTVSQAGSGALSNGSYQAFAVYEWVDGNGQQQRSAPSAPLTFTVTGGTDNKPTYTIPTLRMTAKAANSPISIAIYRTVANGTEPFRVTSFTSPLLNDTTVDSVTFLDTVSDTNAQKGLTLYTYGNILEDLGGPPALALTTFDSRLIVLDAEERLLIWASKQVVPGQPVEMNDLLTISVPPLGGDVTALGVMDATLLIFKSTSIFGIQGSGPDDTGANSQWQDPALITTAAGCSEPRSIVTTPMGVMFKSLKGYYLLDRGMQASYIGADMEAYNDAPVASAVLIANKNQVRFALADGSQKTLVFDYFRKEWSVFTNTPTVDATLWNDVYVYARPDGRLYQEDPTVFTDAGVHYRRKFQTSWLKFGQLAGFQRVWHCLLTGEYKDGHQLHIQAAYDFGPATQDTYVNATTLLNPGVYGGSTTYGSDAFYGGALNPYQIKYQFQQQKCQALSLIIEDVPDTTSSGESFVFEGLTFEVGVKKGTAKLPAAKQVG